MTDAQQASDEEIAACAESLTDVDRLTRELAFLTSAGIIEVAVRNPRVAEYMEHWEGRAIAAEKSNGELLARLEQAEARVGELEAELSLIYASEGAAPGPSGPSFTGTVEAAARAIALADGVEPDGEIFDAETGVVISPAWKYYETGARAALTAAAPFLTPQIPDGWKLVPTKHGGKAGLTPEMFEAFWRAFWTAKDHHGNFESVNAGYNAMLAASPLPPPPQERTDG